MKKRHKYAEDLLEDYLSLIEEATEINALIKETKENERTLMNEQKDNVLKKRELEDFYRVFNLAKKYEERKSEIQEEIWELETTIKQFLHFTEGRKISLERKDDADKAKHTYVFWLENEQIICNK